MIILLGRAAEEVGEDIEAVYYFMEIEESQVIIKRATEADVACDKGPINYKGKCYTPIKNPQYYGQIAHAVNAYALMRAGHSDTEGAVPALLELVAALDGAMKACRAEFLL